MHPHGPAAPRWLNPWQRLLLAALLFGAQLLLPVHLLDHLHADTGDNCSICLVGHNLGSGHGISHALPPPAISPPHTSPTPDIALVEQPAPSPCQRGPPRTLRIV
jgi:hypothetical protein